MSSLIALLAFVGGVLLGTLVVGESDTASSSAHVRRAVWWETSLLALFAVICLARVPMLQKQRAREIMPQPVMIQGNT